MAIGLGRMFNFHFLENFNFPYSAVSIQDFWRRWHISLSTWFRDYLYIPLGGNRKTKFRTYLNLLIVFLLCGLWHGAAWNFIIWGIWHGIGLIWERIGGNRIIGKLPAFVANLYVLLFVLVGWVIFRAHDMRYAYDFLCAMFTGNNVGTRTFFSAVYFMNYSNIIIMILGFALAYPWLSAQLEKRLPEWSKDILYLLLFAVSYVFAVTSTFSPFIYFRF